MKHEDRWNRWDVKPILGEMIEVTDGVPSVIKIFVAGDVRASHYSFWRPYVQKKGIKMNDLTNGFYKSSLAFHCTEGDKTKTRNDFKKDLQKAAWNWVFNQSAQ